MPGIAVLRADRSLRLDVGWDSPDEIPDRRENYGFSGLRASSERKLEPPHLAAATVPASETMTIFDEE
jgi:hypothetical protein